jgi:hypothetical protein
MNGLKAAYFEERSGNVRLAINQLNEYFNKERTESDVPVLPVGTSFQMRAWKEFFGQDPVIPCIYAKRRLKNRSDLLTWFEP